ncbi:MAG: chromosome segregation protein SMC [Chloroherpetonaceae bacterium]|nr:chromosome segregation protein SMC [Chloroherpetonaceae bacterium]
MYLSKLELFGFKSFAQRVNLKFDSGLTAIVGPNGCGKTNIVDAIRWVLGEQKTSVLRSDKMENVIFNGTRTRKPLGMSEVSITIENTKNILPTEYAEVTLTRRLYRNGDSEYLLNKVPCRLKDITDLFADTGMGSDAYSVIELKMIEQILSDNAEERRRLFEEAAGVTKYKQRRKQTFKKLETTAQDLSRVNDIVLEVEKKVASLERQAKKAEQAKQLRQELKTLEIELAERDIAELKKQIAPIQERLIQSENEKTELTAKIDALDAELEKKRLEIVEIEKRLAQSQRQLNEKLELITATEKQILANEERRKSLAESIERAKAESQRLEQRQVELAALRQSLAEERAKADATLRARRETLAAESAQLREREASLKRERESLEAKRRDSAKLANELSALRLQTESLKARLENFATQIARSQERKAILARQIAEREQAVEQGEAELRELQGALESAQSELANAKAERAALSERLAKAKESLLHLRAEERSKQNRIEFLKALLDRYEGLPEGAKFLDSEKGKRFGLGVLSDLIATDEQYKLAIDAALGDALAYYLSRTEAEAREAIAELKAADKGKLTFVVMEKLSATTTSETPNVDGLLRATSVVRCPDEARPVVARLLANVFLVESLEEAQSLSARYPTFTFATLSGELQSQEKLRGGSNKGAESLRIGKREELERLEAERAALASQIQALERDISIATESLNQIALQKFEQHLRDIERRIAATERRLAQQTFERSSFETESLSLDERIAFDQAESQKIQRDLSVLAPRLAEIDGALAELNRQIESERETVAASESALQSVAAKVRQAELETKAAEFEVEKIEARSQTLEIDSRNAARQLERLKDDIERAQEESFRLASESETMNANLRRLYAEKSESQAALSNIEGDYSILKSDVAQSEHRLRDLSRQREVASQMILEFQRAISQARLKEEHLRAVIQTEYGATLEAKEFDESAPFNRQEAEEKIASLKAKLRGLGAVNELALEEFEEEKKRLEFLTSQRQDLLDAEKQLRDTIDEINETAQAQFQKTFEQIRQNFINIFRELFNEGDEADLILQDADDKLEANIDIIAKPKGKRPQSISLLSGGEKTLTATALLFAIYLVKPSPFCILDEVDAPLDDANIDRFIRLIKKFSDETQFIIVTHNKRTMEACKTLYGVTMEEEGVSKLVAVRFADIEKT